MPVLRRRPAPPIPTDEESSGLRNTPLLPKPLSYEGRARGTLTVLTGVQAGRVLAVDGDRVTIGRAADADLVVDEIGVSRYHVRVAREPQGRFYAEDLASTNGTFICDTRIGLALLRQLDVLRVGPELRVRFAIVDAVEESLGRHLYESSVRDPLTQAFNRRHLADRMLAEIARARRSQTDLSVLMIDVDALKTVNDGFGHLAGDRALCAVATRVQHAIRAEDVFARYGGDELVVLALGTGHAAALELADRVRRAVGNLRMSAGGREVAITTSIGVVSLHELSDSDEPVATQLLGMADARMYGAKSLGGNKVSTEGASGPPRSAQVPGVPAAEAEWPTQAVPAER
jgi:diguanylate cyclase (GGDEF)-like protein